MIVSYLRTVLAVNADALKVDKRAVTAIEYGLIAALVAVAIIGAVYAVGTGLKLTFGSVTSELS